MYMDIINYKLTLYKKKGDVANFKKYQKNKKLLDYLIAGDSHSPLSSHHDTTRKSYDLQKLWSDPKYKSSIKNVFKNIVVLSDESLEEIMTKSDLEIYSIFHQYLMRDITKDQFIKNKIKEVHHQSKMRFQMLDDIFDIREKTILDIGTTDCDYISQLNTKADAHGINIEDMKAFNYVTDTSCVEIYDGIHIPYPDSFFDIVTITMVLHHIDNLNGQTELIKEIYRVLKPDGYLFIKEHDILNDKQKIYTDFIHYFYELSYNYYFNIDYLEIHHSTRYLSKTELDHMLRDTGFVPAKLDLKSKYQRLFLCESNI